MPAGAGGLPLRWSLPWLNGRNRVLAPASSVVMKTRCGSTAKCTTARFDRNGSFGSRSVLYCFLASSTPWCGEQVLQLDRGDSQSVDPQHDVERVVVLRAVPLLAGDGEPVGLVLLPQPEVLLRRRPEVAEPERAAPALDAVAENVDRSPGVELAGEALAELELGPVGVVAHRDEQLVPLVDLRRPDERHQLVGGDAGMEVDAIRCAERPAGAVRLRQRGDDLVLEVHLLRLRHHGTSISPLTAAVTSERRRSSSRVICLSSTSSASARALIRRHASSTIRSCSSTGGRGTRMDSMSGM